MKILVVSNMFPSETDPSYGTFVKNFHDDILSRNGAGDTYLSTIRGRRYSKAAKLLAYTSFYSGLLWKLLARRYDLIYVHTVTFPTPALLVASVFRKLPLVLNVHGGDVLPSNSLKRKLRDLSAPLVRKALMIVTPSEYFKGVTLDVFKGLDKDRIFISPSGGVARKFFHKKTEINPGDRPLTLGFVSRIDRGKGWEIYLRAVKTLLDNGIACRGIIAGGGRQETMLHDEICRLGLDTNVKFIGRKSPDELSELYRTFDLFIFPTCLSESLGLVGIEAMAAGVPVIASDIAGPAGYVRPGENGYLFTPGSSDDLATKITEYLQLDATQKQQMSETAYRAALPFESTHVASLLYAKLQRLLS